MEEALRLSGTSEASAALEFFTSFGVGAAIITHGPNDIHFFADNTLFGKIPQTTLPVSEKVKADLKQNLLKAGDTTGCGDNFAGGIIASIAKQLIISPGNPIDFIEAIALGVASGGFACFYNGGTFYEEYHGQKEAMVKAFYTDYLSQIQIYRIAK